MNLLPGQVSERAAATAGQPEMLFIERQYSWDPMPCCKNDDRRVRRPKREISMLLDNASRLDSSLKMTVVLSTIARYHIWQPASRADSRSG